MIKVDDPLPIQKLKDKSSASNDEFEQLQQMYYNPNKTVHFFFIGFVLICTLLFISMQCLLLYQGLTEAMQKLDQKQQQLKQSIDVYKPNFKFKQAQESMAQIQLLHLLDWRQKYDQLPFCILLTRNRQQRISLQATKQSIKQLKYQNYVVIEQLSTVNVNGPSYKQAVNAIRKSNCKNNSLILYVNQPIHADSLSYINNYFQKYNIWSVFTQSQDSYQLIAFLWRIFELLQNNDFDGSNSKYLNLNLNLNLNIGLKQQKQETDYQHMIGIQSIGIMELSALHFKKINKHRIYKQTSFLSHLYYDRNNPVRLVNRTAYLKITKLSQDYKGYNVSQSLQYKYLYKQRQIQVKQLKISNLTQQQMPTAIQRLSIPYLPEQHNIIKIERLEYQQKYKINKYYGNGKQVRFCVTVISKNNEQHNRYKKVMKTILMQNYTNYHIVFIDDYSTDRTMQLTMQYLNKHNFHSITYIKNKKQMFATYNILNAAYNYCDPNDIQLLIDGDDQLIGKHVFNVFNAAYQNNNSLWMVYSTYKDNWYQYGRSHYLLSQQDHYKNGRRELDTGIGAIRTWKLKLFYNIPLKYHQKKNGSWLDTIYDDAFAHSLLELASVKHILYLPEILYQYNRGYGNNDDGSRQRIEHRNKDYEDIRNMKKLNFLNETQFTTSVKNEQIYNVLKKDQGLNYQKIKAF